MVKVKLMGLHEMRNITGNCLSLTLVFLFLLFSGGVTGYAGEVSTEVPFEVSEGIVVENGGLGEVSVASQGTTYNFLILESPRKYNFSEKRTVWYFPRVSVDECKSQLRQTGIKSHLFDWATEYISTPYGVLVFPSEKMIFGMRPETRARLRRLLQKNVENLHYSYPIVIPAVDVAAWYEAAGLSPTTASLIASLCYVQGGVSVFSDVVYVYSQLEEEAERDRFLRALTRIRTVDADATVDSAAADQPGHAMKLVSLLPWLPRKLLNTYPQIDDSKHHIGQNCHWISRNFFASDSESFVPALSLWDISFNDEYELVDQAPRYGDIIAFFDSQTGQLLHSAVEIDGPVVFTKNGFNLNSPWVFMLYQDVRDIYAILSEGGAVVTKTYHRRDRSVVLNHATHHLL